jgi:hypothetical protein
MSSQQVLFLYDLFAINNWVLMLSVKIAIASPAPGRLRAVAIFESHYISRAGRSNAHHLAAVDDSAIMVYFRA